MTKQCTFKEPFICGSKFTQAYILFKFIQAYILLYMLYLYDLFTWFELEKKGFEKTIWRISHI